MEYSTLYALMSLGFGLGMLHALDADHIMAVSSLSSAQSQKNPAASRKSSAINTIWFCCRWALGHGAVIFALSLLFVLTRLELPQIIPDLAEKLIGIILIGIGSWIIWSLHKHKIALEVHSHSVESHDNIPSDKLVHAHLTESGKTRHSHQPVLVGITHGIAGSAPVLALIPAAEHASPALALIYISLFCLGVLLSMCLFGLFFAEFQSWIAGASNKVFQTSRLIIASISIGFGTYWLIQ